MKEMKIMLRISSIPVMIVSLALAVSGCDFCDLISGTHPPRSAQIFAAEVVDINILQCGLSCNPNNVIGRPDGDAISLGGLGGYIIVMMSEPFTNGTGIDLRIYETGPKEPFQVFISSDAATWVQIGTTIKANEGSGYAPIDIAPYAESGDYRYVKIVDQSTIGGANPGSDIDAIEALWSSE